MARQEDRRFRPAYPADPPDNFYRQTASSAPYPDAAFDGDDGMEPAPPALNDGYQSVFFSNAPAPRSAPPRRRGRGPWTFIALVACAAFVLVLYLIFALRQPYAAFRTMAAETAKNTFAYGIYVDGVSIGGMTRAQAESALQNRLNANGGELSMDLQVDHYAWHITGREIPFTRNLSRVLDRAWVIGRQGTTQTLTGGMTPLYYRYQHRMGAAKNGAYFYTEVTYDKSDVHAFVSQVAAYVNRDAQDAQVATFDFETRTFTFTDDQQGAKLNEEQLYEQLVTLLDGGQFSASIRMETQPVMPSVTKVELMNSFARVSAYTTTTTADANRNNNIALACQAVSGTVVMPGETFSFNETTGQRTTEKGYLPAAAIAGGTTVDEVGGGVCQVSSTLFNAAAMADMTIVTRSPHTWPSNYVDKGRDATVNWPNLDFQFKNTSAAPVFIVATYAKRTCTVEIYGVSLGPGVTIELETVTTSVTDPPAEPAYTHNPNLGPGEQNVLKKARTGYTVETYRVYLRNGAEYRRELLCNSTYRMIQQLIEYN